MLAHILLFLAIAGTLTSTIFLVLVLLAAARFHRNAKRKAAAVAAIAREELPFLSVMKPVHGMEPNLRTTLASFFQQDYPGYELIFGAREASDPALTVVEDLKREYPHVKVKIVLSGTPTWPNAKIFSLEKMLAQSESQYLMISDSDVTVAPDYLRNIVVPLLKKEVGLVTCVYRGVPLGGFWALLEALGMSTEMTSGVLVADMLEGMRFALGPTMATRRDALDRIGGIATTADYYSDDFELGNKIAAAGYKVELSHHIIEHMVTDVSFAKSLDHQLRWMKSTRYSRPAGHVGTGLTFAVPFGLLGLAAALLGAAPVIGYSIFAWSLLNRMLQSLFVGWGITRDKRSLALFWLFPLRDLLGFLLWVLSFTGGSFVWRGERYHFQKGGRIIAERTAGQ